MATNELTKEERILRMTKKVLTDVAKDTYTRPGFKHSLSDHTLEGIRECLRLITAREAELAEEHGRPMNARPRVGGQGPDSVVVPLDSSGRKKPSEGS
jgi:hypothetical protein